jgi:hypothetical protein
MVRGTSVKLATLAPGVGIKPAGLKSTTITSPTKAVCKIVAGKLTALKAGECVLRVKPAKAPIIKLRITVTAS